MAKMDAYQYHWYTPKCSLFLDEVRVLQTYEPADGGFGSAAYSTILGFIGRCRKTAEEASSKGNLHTGLEDLQV